MRPDNSVVLRIQGNVIVLLSQISIMYISVEDIFKRELFHK